MAENALDTVSRTIRQLEALFDFQTIPLLKPIRIKWFWKVKEEFQQIKDTLITIKPFLEDAQEQQSTNTDIRIWLTDLNAVTTEIDDVIMRMLNHDLRSKSRSRTTTSTTTLWYRYPGSNEVPIIKSLAHNLAQLDSTRKKYFKLKQQPPITPLSSNNKKKSLFRCFANAAGSSRGWKAGVDAVLDELRLRGDDRFYSKPTQPQLYPKFLRFTEIEMYRIANCRVSTARSE